MKYGIIICYIGGLLLTLSCHSHEEKHSHEGENHHEGDHHDERPSRLITHWTETSELFVEFPSLVVGKESPFAAHLTRLSDFKAIESGKATVILSGGNMPDEKYEVSAPQVAGLFRPIARPQHAIKRRLVIQLESDELTVLHDLGEFQVFANIEAARKASVEEEETGLISFSKEQQWKIEFGTQVTTKQMLRPSIPAFGVLRATPEGEMKITAPLAGRLLSAGSKFPQIGMQVEANQTLASLTPQLGASADLSTLELTVTETKLSASYAKREHLRLKGLRTDGAVPERSVQDAQHRKESADARLQAAKRRLSHYRRLQRPGGKGSRGINIRSPIAGVLTAVDVAPGSFVTGGREMFHVINLDRLWIEVHIPEANIGRLSKTSGVWFEVDGFDHTFEVLADPVAKGAIVNPQTRTIPLVFALDNPSHQLRVGMRVRANVFIGQPLLAIAVPMSALINDNGQDVIYVQSGGETFERRVVQLGKREGQLVQINSGLKSGEHVVIKGAYAVKLASSSTEAPAHGHAH